MKRMKKFKQKIRIFYQKMAYKTGEGVSTQKLKKTLKVSKYVICMQKIITSYECNLNKTHISCSGSSRALGGAPSKRSRATAVVTQLH